MPEKPYIIVSADFGASNSRLILREQTRGNTISPNTIFVASRKTTRSIGPNGYLCEDVDIALKELLCQLHRALTPHQRKRVSVFSISSHGSSNFICLDSNGKPIFGTPSYDHNLTEKDHKLFYNKFGHPDELYLETGTPNQPKALNWAKLLFHHITNHKDEWKKVKYIVSLNVYVGSRLCDSADAVASEHTQMHNHGYGQDNKGNLSKVIRLMDIENLLPPFKKPYDILGNISPKIAEKYGFNKNCIVVVGGHDSSLFAMLPPLLGFGNAVTISAGTWDVIMAHGRKFCLETKLQNKGLLYNATVENEPLRTVLFRGGDMRTKYIEQYGNTPIDVKFDNTVLNKVIMNSDIIIPAYMEGFGPYPNSDTQQKISSTLKKDHIRFHHALAMSLALQRALALQIAGRTKLPKRISISEFSNSRKIGPVIVGGHLAENYKENGKYTNQLTVSMEVLRRVVMGRIYRLNFPEPTSVATHILGICAWEGIQPKQIEKGRINLKIEDVTFKGNTPNIDKYVNTFEKQINI